MPGEWDIKQLWKNKERYAGDGAGGAEGSPQEPTQLCLQSKQGPVLGTKDVGLSVSGLSKAANFSIPWAIVEVVASLAQMLCPA